MDIDIDEYKSELDYLINNYKQKIHHSWIFHGPKGSGKSMFLDYFFKKFTIKKIMISLFMKLTEIKT